MLRHILPKLVFLGSSAPAQVLQNTGQSWPPHQPFLHSSLSCGLGLGCSVPESFHSLCEAGSEACLGTRGQGREGEEREEEKRERERKRAGEDGGEIWGTREEIKGSQCGVPTFL